MFTRGNNINIFPACHAQGSVISIGIHVILEFCVKVRIFYSCFMLYNGLLNFTAISLMCTSRLQHNITWVSEHFLNALQCVTSARMNVNQKERFLFIFCIHIFPLSVCCHAFTELHSSSCSRRSCYNRKRF